MGRRHERFILAQGSMDGACFLYSVANAISALSGGKSITSQHWSDMLQSLKRVDDFMDQQVGTENCDPRPQHQMGMVRRMVKALTPNQSVAVSLVPADDLTGKRLAALLSPESVLVGGTQDHWVCAVDVDQEGRNLLVADSSQLHDVEHYTERTDGRFGRVTNNVWSAAPQKRYYRAFRIGSWP
jgi:hypothetical protein